MNKLLCLLSLTFCLSCSRQIPKKTFKLSPMLNEVSGLYIDDANHFWWLNDSGDSAQLYQTNPTGNLTKKVPLPRLQNRDWEDLSNDDKGNIYIGDFGNNRNQRKDLRIYMYHPNSQKLDSIRYTYPDQQAFPPKPEQANFDMEAFFWYQDSLHLFSKNKLWTGDYQTKHYTLPEQSSDLQTAILKDKLFLKNRVVTAAAISPDGKTVALLSYFYKKIWGFIPYSSASIFLIKNFHGTDFLKGEVYKKRAPYFLLATQFESLDFWDNETIYIASEKTLFIAPKVKRIKLKTRDFKNKKKVVKR